jgi:hypothetical protein
MLNTRQIKDRSTAIRNTIKAIIAQLDRWAVDQQGLERRRAEANARYPRGLSDRQDIAQHRARTALQTQDLRDPPCDLCGSTVHLSDECDRIERVNPHNISEDPSIGIHRAIVHRLYLQSCDLYRLVHPRFYPGPLVGDSTEDIYPVPLTGPDYLQIAISKAVEDFQVVPGFRPDDIRGQRPGCSSIALLYYSKAFPLTFGDFCCRIGDRIEELAVE